MSRYINNKIGFRAKKISRDKESYFIMIHGSSHQEDITILNYVPNNITSKYMKQRLLKLQGTTDKSTIIFGDVILLLKSLIKQVDRKSVRL